MPNRQLYRPYEDPRQKANLDRQNKEWEMKQQFINDQAKKIMESNLKRQETAQNPETPGKMAESAEKAGEFYAGTDWPPDRFQTVVSTGGDIGNRAREFFRRKMRKETHVPVEGYKETEADYRARQAREDVKALGDPLDAAKKRSDMLKSYADQLVVQIGMEEGRKDISDEQKAINLRNLKEKHARMVAELGRMQAGGQPQTQPPVVTPPTTPPQNRGPVTEPVNTAQNQRYTQSDTLPDPKGFKEGAILRDKGKPVAVNRGGRWVRQ